jgi:O-antigen/teichoic acid export membrane protein
VSRPELDSAFSKQDRKKAHTGTILSIVGGVILALVRALGFFLRAVFGGEMWGLYAIAWALTELLAFFILGGFNDAVVIFASRVHARNSAESLSETDGERDFEALATILVAPFCIAFLAALALHFLSPLMHELLWAEHDPLIVDLVKTLAWSLPLLVLVQVPAEATRSSLKFGYAVGIVQIAFPVLSLVLALLLFYTVTPSILAVAQGAVLALVLLVPASFYAFSRHFDLGRTLRASLRGRWDREALSFALPQSLNMALNQGLVRLDSLMLSFFGVSANTIGIYSLVGDLTQLIRLAKMAFSGVYSPLVARYRALSNQAGVAEALDHFVRKTSSLGVVLFLVVMSLWPIFIFTQGETWTDSRLFPWLLCVGPLMSCFFGLCGNTLLMYGYSRLLLSNALASGAMNVILNALLIPPYGVFGAALATAIANLTISVLQVVELRRLEDLGVDLKVHLRTAVAAAPSIVAVYVLGTSTWPLRSASLDSTTLWLRVTLAVASVIVYGLLLFALPGRRAPLDGANLKASDDSTSRK